MSLIKSIFIWSFILLTSSFFSTSIERFYELDSSALEGKVIVQTYQLSVYGNWFSVKEWWASQPVVTLKFEGEEKYRQLVETSLEQLGFVLADGDLMRIRLEEVQKGVLFLETSYMGSVLDNRDALMTIGEDFEKMIFDFFLKAFGQHYKELPRLIIVKSENRFTTDAQILYTGPQYSVLKSFKDELSLKGSQDEYNLIVPFYPICYLDLSQENFLLSIDSSEKLAFSIDSRVYYAPIELKMNKGVHRIECCGNLRHVYLLKDMRIDLDSMAQKAQLSLSVSTLANIEIYRTDELFFSSTENEIDIELTPGQYTISVSKEGYQEYIEHMSINSSERLIRNIDLVPNPGTLIHSLELEKGYMDVFFCDKRVLLIGADESVLIDLASGETKVEKVRSFWFDGQIILSENKILDMNFKPLFSFDETLNSAVNTPGGLWVFTANKNIISLNPNNYNLLWKRRVDYLAYDIVKKDELVCVLDAYSRLILIDCELGYTERFNVRIAGVVGIDSIEESQEKIRVYLAGFEGYIDYYRKSKALDIGKNKTQTSEKEFELIDNLLYQWEKPLIKVWGNLIKIEKNDDLIAVLTDKELKVCVGY